ncbi:Arylsulfatase [Caulifigura coniformis]|uniref:Arylsulfatase n=1 Tax=Caulifigura coniformis TaxID=2527983 RepID=A0A517SHK7_9PLAN|nr:sulfatase [Caulifigura coniformis]QDT55618.1 Arylsulfatase [Caulifigura coniformis]
MTCRLFALAFVLFASVTSAHAAGPNVVLIVCDNLGHGDLGCTGSTLHRTPAVDRMAAEGTRFTSFYVASGVCTPSRAAIMTGCYPRRLNLHVSDRNGAVLQPLATKGLNPAETTIAEVLKSQGYATACIGKWHLGDQPEFLPTRQGFDEFFGIPYSDDMTRDKKPDEWPELPLMRGETVIEAPADRNTLVARCTSEAIAFIEAHRQQPFFVYLPHTMPGSTAHPFASPAFKGKSRNGDYGDSVEELDWSTGEVLAALKRLGLDDRTIVVWTSDNGAPRRNPPQGSNSPFKGYGYDTSEGAMRMPCIIRWPGRVPAGRVSDELWSSLDLLPTLASLATAPGPTNEIDGFDVSGLWTGVTGWESPYDKKGFFYYRMDQLQAVRSGPWKLYLPLEARFANLNRKSSVVPLQLFNVRSDVGELQECSAAHPDVVHWLTALAESMRVEVGDVNRPGRSQRPAGTVPEASPLLPR